MKKVYLGIPATGSRTDVQAIALEKLRKKYEGKVEFVYPEHCVRRIFHDYARNEIVKEFLATDCDVLWFLDSDIFPSLSVPDLITEHWDMWMVAGASYPVWMNDPTDNVSKVLFTIYDKNDKGTYNLSPAMRSGTGFVDGLATGCMMIKRGLLEMMKAPYFEFKYDPETRAMVEGEDLGFCLKVNQMGYKFFTDHSMVCGHYKQVNLLDVSNYAVEMSNYKVMAYDAQIKPQVAKLAAAYQKLKSGKVDTGLILPSRPKLVTP